MCIRLRAPLCIIVPTLHARCSGNAGEADTFSGANGLPLLVGIATEDGSVCMPNATDKWHVKLGQPIRSVMLECNG